MPPVKSPECLSAGCEERDSTLWNYVTCTDALLLASKILVGILDCKEDKFLFVALFKSIINTNLRTTTLYKADILTWIIEQAQAY